ncbi:MAG: thioredoxin family protein [Candidatus Margulisiibacteriota bacterium]
MRKRGVRKSYIVIFVLLLIIGYLFLNRNSSELASNPKEIAPQMITPTSTTTTTIKGAKKSVIKSNKIKILVLTLYRSGEGESDLAAYVSRGMNYEAKDLANFKQLEVSASPQIIESYGVETLPAIIFISPSGKVVHKHSGYADKEELLGILNKIRSLK